MDRLRTSRIHKVALIGQHGAGKTSLAEALLAKAGAIPKKGRVDDGTAACDYEPEELSHHASLSLALASFTWGEHKVDLLDTPGLPDGIAEVEAALAVADLAIMVVSAIEELAGHGESIWRAAEARSVPRIVFVNKLDHERADFSLTVAQLRAAFGPTVAPIELPVAHAGALADVADLLGEPDGAKRSDASDLDAERRRVHDELVEGIVVGDEALLQRYLDGESPSPVELEEALAKEIAAGNAFPVLCGSAATDVGVERLANFACEVARHRPAHVRAGDKDIDVEPDAAAPPLARAFKTLVDPYVGKVSLLEVISGTLRPDTVLVNPRTHSEERLHGLESLLGKSASPMDEAIAGDVVAIPKLRDVRTGDTLAPRGSPVVLDTIGFSPPSLSIAVRPRTTGDEDKLMTGLHRLEEEDPGLTVTRDAERNQIVLSGAGEVHLQVALERLARKFHVEVDTEPLRVPYRQTISRPAQAEGRHKKQTGGHGQFGVVHLRIEPLPVGEGFVFVDEVTGGAIPRQFVPAVEQGVRRAMRQGGDLGFPVVDVKVIVDDGKAHSVDSSEASFEQAGILAFTEALRLAEPQLLEPISRLEVSVPSRYLGEVLGDLNVRRARVLASESDEHGDQHVVALVPTSECERYVVDLKALSAGHGSFSLHHDHYAPLPAHLLDTVLGRRPTKVS